MLADVVWSNRARQALLEIYVSIGMHDVGAAERVYERLEALTSLLSRQPRMGPRRPDLGPTVRILVENPYLILYEINPGTDAVAIETVEIVNVVDGRRDPRPR